MLRCYPAGREETQVEVVECGVEKEESGERYQIFRWLE
jgi:hypothetical protein